MTEPQNTQIQLVRDLMTVGVVTCAPGTPITDLAHMMLERSLEEVVVLEEGHAVGVVTQDELVRAYTRPDFHSLTAEEVMKAGIPQVPPDIPIAAAAQVMLDRKVRALFLMHQAAGIEYPAAVISYRHLLRHLCARNSDDLRDLGIYAERQSPLEAFFQRRDAARNQKPATPGDGR